jgi:hypothetical protein
MDYTAGRLLCLASIALSSSASAQYTRSPRDTVRVREVTTGTMRIVAPTGAIDARTEHDAVIAVAFGPADSAQAWYESLRLAMRLPQGAQEPSTAEALRRPFVLRFDDRGRIETLSSPTFPASFEGVTDLSHQFDDLFPRLPATPLALGMTWIDTAVVEANGSTGRRSRHERITSNRVVRDTTVAGERAWVIASTQRLADASSQPVKGQPLTAHTKLTGADTGVFVFSRVGRGLLGRERSGSLSGSLTYEGGSQPVVVQLQQSYRNTVTRVQ